MIKVLLAAALGAFIADRLRRRSGRRPVQTGDEAPDLDGRDPERR